MRLEYLLGTNNSAYFVIFLRFVHRLLIHLQKLVRKKVISARKDENKILIFLSFVGGDDAGQTTQKVSDVTASSVITKLMRIPKKIETCEKLLFEFRH
jgi:hypothetical protein